MTTSSHSTARSVTGCDDAGRVRAADGIPVAVVAPSPYSPAAWRTLHLVDVENLAGTPAPSPSAVALLRSVYLDVSDAGPLDHVVIGTARPCAAVAWFAWPDARRVLRSGADGADRALLDVIANEAPALRFARVVIGSGDGIFAEACARLQAAGCDVLVVARGDALSRRLRLAVREARLLPPLSRVAPLRVAYRRAA